MLTSAGTGLYRASEGSLLAATRRYKADGTKRLCLFSHGASGTAQTAIATALNHLPRTTAIVDAGYALASFDYGVPTVSSGPTSGPRHFGCDNAITACGTAITFAQTAPTNGNFVAGFGAAAGAYVALAFSMGALLLLNYLVSLANPAAVCSAVVLGIPLLDLNDAYQNDKGGERASIGAAHGVTYPTAIPNLATHSPAAFSGANKAKLTMPISIFAASDDPVASNTAACQTWAATVGSNVTVTDLGAVGHDSSSMSAADTISALQRAAT